MEESVSVVCWNCRGAGNDNFMRNFLDLKRVYRPAIVAILEPRVGGAVADRQCGGMGMSSWYRVEADGFRGGIWLLWDDEQVKVVILHAQPQFVHVMVAAHQGRQWCLTIVYASPNTTIRASIWSELRRMIVAQPWCVMGDFNSVVHSSERWPPG